MNIFVIVPTLNRETLSDSLNSIINQSLLPSKIIVVFENELGVTRLNQNKVIIEYTENLRTKNLSGAINHAVDEIISNRFEWGINLEDTWIALLDDDDWWDPNYLMNCSRLIDDQTQQIVSGLTRYDETNESGYYLPIPESLDSSSFLINNPNIQGSNIFVRLDAFLEAGGFDESLFSCTDRDFCIRLFERKNHNWVRLNEFLVHHDARKIGRISDKGSIRKIQGLRRFAMKHQFRMNNDIWNDFVNWSKSKFNYIIDDGESIKSPLEPQINLDSQQHHFSRKMTIGVTLGDLEFSKRFIESLQDLTIEIDGTIKLVICLHRISQKEIEKIITNADMWKHEIIIHDEEWGHQKAIEGKLGPWFTHKQNRSGVSWGRCVLHYALWLETNAIERPLIWILDDDIIFEKNHLKQISNIVDEMNCKGFKVGIGHIIGDPPLMPMYTLRTQLIDFHYAKLSNQNSRRKRIELDRFQFHDMHHDLSTFRTDHLEFPIGFHDAINSDDKIQSILFGKAVTRKVHSDWKNFSGIPSRGGNTLLLDSEPLGKWSNIAPNCGGIQFRRGDSLWTKWIELENNELICGIPLVVTQKRSKTKGMDLDIHAIRGDIAGSMLVREIQALSCVDDVSKTSIPLEILSNSKRREARLIVNLKRIEILLELLNQNEELIQEIKLMNNLLISNNWPHNFTHDLGKFLDELSESMKIFRIHHQK